LELRKFTDEENVIFTPMQLGDTLSDWNQICCRDACQVGGVYTPSLKKINPANPEIQVTKILF